MTDEELEKCKSCINCDIDGTCIAKQEAPFDSFVCEHNEMFESCEEETEKMSDYIRDLSDYIWDLSYPISVPLNRYY